MEEFIIKVHVPQRKVPLSNLDPVEHLGFLVKLELYNSMHTFFLCRAAAQHVGSMVKVVPQEYTETLSVLQDKVSTTFDFINLKMAHVLRFRS
jgi:hypothetical protein